MFGGTIGRHRGGDARPRGQLQPAHARDRRDGGAPRRVGDAARGDRGPRRAVAVAVPRRRGDRTREYGSFNLWLVWPALGLLVAGSFLPLLFDGGAIVAGVPAARVPAPPLERRGARPRDRAAAVGAAAHRQRRRHPAGRLESFRDEPSGHAGWRWRWRCVLANVSARATGETDFSAGGSVGTITSGLARPPRNHHRDDGRLAVDGRDLPDVADAVGIPRRTPARGVAARPGGRADPRHAGRGDRDRAGLRRHRVELRPRHREDAGHLGAVVESDRGDDARAERAAAATAARRCWSASARASC